MPAVSTFQDALTSYETNLTSPGWHVSREAHHVYTWLFVITYYLSCDMAISYLLV